MSDAALIDRFLDALWLEDGLSRLTLAAYRRDLSLLAAWRHAVRPHVDLTRPVSHHPGPFPSPGRHRHDPPPCQ